MEPPSYEQLQGKRNSRSWKRQFKIAALAKGVWDVFSGEYEQAALPNPGDYGLKSLRQAQADADAAAAAEEEEQTEDGFSQPKDKKMKTATRTTLLPEDIKNFMKEQAEEMQDKKTGFDFSSRMSLYKFQLDEYDKGRRILSTAMALLMNWVHPMLRGQLETYSNPKEAYDHLVTRYSVTNARARELAEARFNSIFISKHNSAQDYINALENSKQDILEAGGYCDDPMMISKIIRGLRSHHVYKDFATQYHLLRDIDEKFDDVDHVITQLLTFESNHAPEPDFRGRSDRPLQENFPQRQPREKCNACGIWGHMEANCRRTPQDRRIHSNTYNNRNNGRGNHNNRPNYSPSGSNNGKPNGMAAAAIINQDSFTDALRKAKTDLADEHQPVQGH